MELLPMALDHTHHPALRLVAQVDDRARVRTPSNRASIRVARENASAAQLTAQDARWVFAVRVRDALEGGQAAILPPDRRERLVRLATRIGLRPFDANLIVAVVQDSVRTGRSGLDESVEQRLHLIRQPLRAATSTLSIVLALVLGLGILAVLIAWVLI